MLATSEPAPEVCTGPSQRKRRKSVPTPSEPSLSSPSSPSTTTAQVSSGAAGAASLFPRLTLQQLHARTDSTGDYCTGLNWIGINQNRANRTACFPFRLSAPVGLIADVDFICLGYIEMLLLRHAFDSMVEQGWRIPSQQPAAEAPSPSLSESKQAVVAQPSTRKRARSSSHSVTAEASSLATTDAMSLSATDTVHVAREQPVGSSKIDFLLTWSKSLRRLLLEVKTPLAIVPCPSGTCIRMPLPSLVCKHRCVSG